ncbi:MAG: DUF2088 domain-containing protein [Rhodospirillales bacterium]|nr:DUF2088 domain-containing protein [Rhodospirillales bacterium]
MKFDEIDVPLQVRTTNPFPDMVDVEQRFTRDHVADVEGAVRAEMQKLAGASLAGKRIAVAAGSRGIAAIDRVVRTTIEQLKAFGADPFIVPAMASHGGATAEGQIGVLADLGITEKAMGAPIRASMEVVEIGKLEDGMPIFFDKIASQSDGVVLCCRVKPHTDFRGEWESGLYKMLAIGLGKHRGAVEIHSHGFTHFHHLIPQVGRVTLQKMPILFAVAVVENAYHQVLKIEGVPAAGFEERDKALQVIAKQHFARILVPRIDVLVVDELGKDVSGSGMDPNVTGRCGSPGVDFGVAPIHRIVVRDLTEATHGNACGLGLADLTTRRCAEKIDFVKTYTNLITATVLEPAKLPIVMRDDREAITVAIITCNNVTTETIRVVRIKNTTELTRIQVSAAVLADIAGRDDLKVLGAPAPMRFGADNRLI